MNSLRKARETVIPADEPINIYVQSLVKIYERENRWAREWKAGARIRERLGLRKHFRNWKDMTQVSWQLPLFVFMIYFTYFYIQKGFWIFLFSIGTWFFLSAVWNQFRELFTNITAGGEKGILKKLMPVLDFLVFWIVPLLNLVMFQVKWDNIAVVLILGFLWFTGLFIYKTGLKLSRENIDIYRLEGKFRGIRKSIYKVGGSCSADREKEETFQGPQLCLA